jgi:hypothetical protein
MAELPQIPAPAPPAVLKGEWKQIDDEIQNRHTLLLNADKRLRDLVTNDQARLNLAATDVFVEKAQHRLTTRATKFMWAGAVTGGLAVAVLLATAGYVISHSAAEMLGGGGKHDVYLLITAIIRALSIGGFVGGAVYFLGGLSTALLHESVVLLNRRHALRFGRLSVYLQGGKVDAKMLHDLFHWNDEFSTAFKNIKAEEMRKGGLGGYVEPPSKTFEGAAKLAESMKADKKTPQSL